MVLQKHIDPCRSSCVLPLSEKGKNDFLNRAIKQNLQPTLCGGEGITENMLKFFITAAPK
jgi:hypothetical protein